MFVPENIAQCARVYLGDAPVDHLLVGSTELLLDDVRRVHERARAAGVDSSLVVFEDVPHGRQMIAGLVPEATRAAHDAAAFISRHLGRDDARHSR